MKVNVLLADKGTQSPQGTLNLLNVGWTQTPLQPSGLVGPGLPVLLTPPHAVAVFYEVEPKHCNHPIDLIVELVTEDGQAVSVPGPAGPQPMILTQPITVATPGGFPAGTPGIANAILEIFPGLPLEPGGYEWRGTAWQGEWVRAARRR